MKLNIKKGDKVIVISGDAKGKTGTVAKVDREKMRVVVEGLNMATKHTKPSAQNPQGGIVKEEAPIHISNVALISDGKATRVGRKEVNGETVRYAKKTGKNI